VSISGFCHSLIFCDALFEFFTAFIGGWYFSCLNWRLEQVEIWIGKFLLKKYLINPKYYLIILNYFLKIQTFNLSFKDVIFVPNIYLKINVAESYV